MIFVQFPFGDHQANYHVVQVAGRAGRFQSAYEKGWVCSLCFLFSRKSMFFRFSKGKNYAFTKPRVRYAANALFIVALLR